MIIWIVFKNITDVDYYPAQNDWKKLKLKKNMGEYHDLYLITDIL